MSDMRPLTDDEIEQLEALGMTMALEGELLTIGFKNGTVERWLELPQLNVAHYAGLELINIRGRLFTRVAGEVQS